jgi:hypothetical protein
MAGGGAGAAAGAGDRVPQSGSPDVDAQAVPPWGLFGASILVGPAVWPKIFN